MIPDIGLIVSIYAVARLIQVPYERTDTKGAKRIVVIASLVGILGVVIFAADLLMQGTTGLEGLDLGM